MEQTVTMMTEEEAPEVGPNDIVIHLVNPYKCGMCELEFLDKKVFKDHMFSHLEQMKQDRPSSQIVMNISFPPETPGGVTVTRDILQLGEDGSIKQVLQPTTNLTLNQVSPLRELEEAGVLRLDPPKPPVSKPASGAVPGAPGMKQNILTGPGEGMVAQGGQQSVIDPTKVVKIEGEDGEETEVSEIVDNKDGSFSVSFKGPNNEMQHIQILKPEGMKGEMMIELTQAKRRNVRTSGGFNKNNECDICGKILSSSTNLIRHKMYHKSERPFVCEVCNKGFKDISNLKKHTQIHKRVFPCFLCKKSFLLKSLLVEHLKRHEARTTFVKSGNSTKEVTVRTFVDEDGTRVEEMNMASLGNKIFEYKHRIMKADPSEVIKIDDTQMEVDVSVTSNPENAELVAAAENAEAEGTEKESALHKSLMALATAGIKEGESTTEAPGSMLDENATNSSELTDTDEMKLSASVEDFVKVYQCGHCGKRTVQRGNMMRHIIHHLKDKPFGCDECPKKFVDKGELVKHKKTHTKPVRCPQCNGAFAHNRQLMKHLEGECLGSTENLKYTILDDGQTYKCDICQIEMKRLGNIIKHVNTHMAGGKKSWYQRRAQHAKRAYIRMQEFKRTSAPYHYDSSKQVFVCNFCKKMFRQKMNADRHAMAHRSGRFPSKVLHKPYKCDLCSAAFTRKLFLESHKRKHDDKGRDEETADYGVTDDKSGYYCKHCDKKLFKKYRMMSHVQRHISDRLFECPECNKCFGNQYILMKHKKVHNTRVTCDQCGTSFTKQFFLDIHKRKMHPDTEEEFSPFDQDNSSLDVKDFFTCSICGAPFSRLVIMTNHEKKCREESKVMCRLPMGKGFQCKICNKVATLKHNLMVHIRKHEDVVKVDSSGRLFILSENWSADSTSGSPGSNMTPFGKFKRRSRSSPSSSSKKSLKSQMRNELEASDTEYMEVEDSQEEEEDNKEEDRCTKTPGGWACLVCRKKFTDKPTVLRHLQTHDSPQGEQNEGTPQKENGIAQTPMDENEPATDINEEAEKADKDPNESESKIAETERESDDSNTPQDEQAAPSPSKDKSLKKLKTKVDLVTPKKELGQVKELGQSTPASGSRSANRPARTQKIPSRFLE